MSGEQQDDTTSELLIAVARLSLLELRDTSDSHPRGLDTGANRPALLVYAAQIWTLRSPPTLESLLDEFDSRASSRYNQVCSTHAGRSLRSELLHNKAYEADDFLQIASDELRGHLVALEWLTELIEESPYLAPLRLLQARTLSYLEYPDLAAAAAYKALLLLDAVSDDSDEYHEGAAQGFEEGVEYWNTHTAKTTEGTVEGGLRNHRLEVYTLLARSLLECGCLKTSHTYCSRGLELDADSIELQSILDDLNEAALQYYGETTLSEDHASPLSWPDRGQVRRECYPWNTYEPNRLDDLDSLNEMMQAVAPKLEVKAARLPALSTTTSDGQAAEVVQLGVFAREDLLPGDIVLKETSLLTANNKLQDALCDACSVELPELSASADTIACDDCQVVFCSQTCYDMALQSYHPALCEREVESIAKDVAPSEAPDSLYSLLLLRSLAMAETQDCHPLELQEVKYIWGDFNDIDYTTSSRPTTLPFSFKYNIELPFHMLEKMDIDIFANSKYDVWVFNTLYAKFRGTASARLSGLGGRAIRGPEVCAVHPMWCLANHSCDPNVSWKWGGEIAFKVREQRAEWLGKTKSFRNDAGVKKGEEILNHYCDLDLPVQQRREWARGALGGDCMCERCIWESQQSRDD